MIALALLLQAATPEIVPMTREPYHRPLLANPHVEVYEVLLPPGATMAYHAHPTNHLAVVVTPGPLRNEVVGRDPVDRATGPAGTVVYVPAGPAHRQVNTGKTPIRFVAIEMTHRASVAAPTAAKAEEPVLAPPEPGCHVVLDKPDVRVTRCLVAPGTSVTPVHRAAFLRVPISTRRKPMWVERSGPITNATASPTVFVDLEIGAAPSP